MKTFSFFLSVFFPMAVFAQVMPSPHPIRPMMHNSGNAKDLGRGIYDHQVMSATSPDGLRWTKNDKVIFDHASVPDTVIDQNGTIFLYFMDASSGHQMSVAVSHNFGKTWQKNRVEITGRQTQGCSSRMKMSG